MNNQPNINNNIKQPSETEVKLEKMRCIVMDETRCKEIAQKLCAYISSNS